MARPVYNLMRNMLADNLALCVPRQVNGPNWRHVLVTRHIVEFCYVSGVTREQNDIFPLYVYDTECGEGIFEASTRTSNLNASIVAKVAEKMGMNYTPDRQGDLLKTVGPEDILHYCYGVLHSPTYRRRYSQQLRVDFPRIPFTANISPFRSISSYGADLVALHLGDEQYKAASWNIPQTSCSNLFRDTLPIFLGTGDRRVANGYPKWEGGSVYINHTQYFSTVPKVVWDFHLGGHQVCGKWLKDRRGRVLSDRDCNQYQRILVALNETIRLMAEIDKVIDKHGGWPGAFITSQPAAT